MKRLSWKYVAGFIDGEGCIDIQGSKGKYIVPRLRIAQASPGLEVLEILKVNYGGNIYERKAKSKLWPIYYSWEITGHVRVDSVLRNVVNHLEIKKEQARFVLWLTHLKGKCLSIETRKHAIEEFKAMKRDPHRLSETAQNSFLEILRCDSRTDTTQSVGNLVR